MRKILFLLPLLLTVAATPTTNRVSVLTPTETTNVAVQAAANYQNTNSVYGNLLSLNEIYATETNTVTNLVFAGTHTGVTLSGANLDTLTVDSPGKYLVFYSLTCTGTVGNLLVSFIRRDDVSIAGYSAVSLEGTNSRNCSASGIFYLTTNQVKIRTANVSGTDPFASLASISIIKIAP